MKDKIQSFFDKINQLFDRIRPQGGWLSNNKLLLALSLMISIFCWLYVTLYVNADSQKTITDIPIRIDTAAIYEDFGLEMIAITAPDAISDGKVDVNLTGSAYQISQVTADDITVVAQTSSVNKAGEYSLTLALSCSNRDVSVALADSYKAVDIWFDSIMEKNITLDKPQVSGVSVPADSGFIIGEPAGFIKTLSISGPESVIDRIASVQLRAALNQELSATATVEGAIRYLDENGEPLGEDYTKYITILDYNDIEAAEGVAAGAPASSDCIISVPIRMECELEIAPVFRNVPEGFDTNALKYTVSPSTIRLEGDIDVMKKYSEDGIFSLDGIDLGSITPSNSTLTLKLNLSTAVSSLDGVSEVVVEFDMNGFKQDTFTVSAERITLTNADSHNVSIASASVDVAVVGPRAVVDKLAEDDFTIIVDMSNDEWTPGVREKNATILVGNGSRCWAVGTYTVKIKVE